MEIKKAVGLGLQEVVKEANKAYNKYAFDSKGYEVSGPIAEDVYPAKNKSDDFDDSPLDKTLFKWLKDKNSFSPIGDVTLHEEIKHSAYKVFLDNRGNPIFERVKPKTAELYKFKFGPIDETLSEIERFWTLRKDYKDLGLIYSRGMLLYGPPGCHAAGTKILMYDGSFKNVEDIKENDKLMGPDSKPRTVEALCAGIDEMYEIFLGIGNSIIVNQHHILYLRENRPTKEKGKEKGKKIFKKRFTTMTVKEYLSLSKNKKRYYSLVRSECIKYNKKSNLPIKPYLLGLWLGDGASTKAAITTMDKGVVDYINNEATERNLLVRKFDQINNKSSTYSFSTGNTLEDRKKYSPNGVSNRNSLLNDLRNLNLLENKHIPLCYLTASVEDRLELLAGIIDTDGYLSKGLVYEITQKSKKLSEDILQLALSLGFRCSLGSIKKGIKSTGFIGTYNRISISGNIENIPVKIDYKKYIKTKKQFSSRFSRIKEIKPLGKGNYYGFNLSGDHLYLTDDYIIHHNSGKTSAIAQVVEMIVKKGDIVIYPENISALKVSLKALRQIESDRQIVVILEDIDEHLRYEEQSLLHLLDGQDKVEGALYLATTNYIDRFPPRLLRSGRFDKKIFIPQPPKEGRKIYFENKLLAKKKATEKEIDQMAEDTEGFSFGDLAEIITAVYALKEPYEKVLYRLKKSKDGSFETEGTTKHDEIKAKILPASSQIFKSRG